MNDDLSSTDTGGTLMTDLVLVLATLAFVALCVAYVGWCDRIVGPDDWAGDDPAGDDPTRDGRDAGRTEVAVP